MNINPTFDIDNIGINDIRNELDNLKSVDVSNDIKGLFKLKTANSWMEESKIRPIPKMLFDEFWFEGELCILFADTNLGKSILAVQIGNSISNGTDINGFKLEAPKQPVLYFDFELSDKQFENRYSKDYTNHFIFDDNFIRVEIDPDAVVPENHSFEDYLGYSLEQSIVDTDAKILIIDNLTYLKTETEKAKDALPLMKNLKALKNKYNLSILALAHTPKRDLSKPINRNDLQGSKMLMSFTDSSFTIGESQKDKAIRYLKQIKVRQNKFIYDTDNVCICQIDKASNFLQFGLIGHSSEREHLKEISDKDKEQQKLEIIALKNQGKSNIEIGRLYGISEGTIRSRLKKWNIEN